MHGDSVDAVEASASTEQAWLKKLAIHAFWPSERSRRAMRRSAESGRCSEAYSLPKSLPTSESVACVDVSQGARQWALYHLGVTFTAVSYLIRHSHTLSHALSLTLSLVEGRGRRRVGGREKA